MAIALPSQVGAWGSSQEKARGKRWECRETARCPQPAFAGGMCWGTGKPLELEFLSSPSCFPGPWLFPARNTLLAGACGLCGRGHVFQQGGEPGSRFF